MMKILILVLRLVVRVLFRFRAYDTEVLRTPGPVLLLPNHVSWIDWLFLGVLLEEDWKFVVSQASAETSWVHRKIMLNRRTFPIDTTSPYGVKHMAEFLQKKGRLVLFAEGRISRTGSLMKLFDGTGFLLHKTGAKVIAGYLRGPERLPWSPNRNRKRWFPRITAHFTGVLEPPHLESGHVAHARHVLTDWVRDRMVALQYETETRWGPGTVPEAVVATAARCPRVKLLADISNRGLTGRRLLAGTAVLGGELRRTLGAEPRRVGVLLPNVNATPVVLMALWSMGRVPAVLNYTSGSASMLECARLAGLRQVITSRVFVERAHLDLRPLAEAGLRIIWLEEVGEHMGWARRLGGMLRAWGRPGSVLQERAEAEATAVVLFTSGSEGAPKGVELTHHNLMANMRQMLAVIDVQDDDRLFNALPMFHSFGLTVGTLLPLVRGIPVFLYPSPLHYRQVPNVLYFRNSTIFLATNTFLNGYARKAHAVDFQSVRLLFAGAEKVQAATMRLWADQFGVRVLEGYGVTECSPVVSVCTPMYPKPGTAGRFVPGITFRLEPVEGVPEGGRLLVRGPNVMKGYLNPEAQAAHARGEGWYDTGDIARVDEEGFVTILGRLKRFAKVSGEMVSLTAVEEALAGAFPQYGARFEAAIVTLPDEHRGENLICVSNEPRLTLAEVREAVRQSGLSNLCMPREIRVVEEIPKLGTGKVHHRALQEMMS